ncbi:MAG: glycosyltransferase family 4 protein [Planctomycetes bacterium]|nr:glycosyltransferase family 4 protein [Planctomycetota bacterium]
MKRLLALTESPDFVCYRYRIAAFHDALAARGWQLEVLSQPKTSAGFLRQLARIAAADAVVLQRRLLSWWKQKALQASAKLLLYDVDDALFLRDSNHGKAAHSVGRWGRFRQTVRMADACLAGNEFLVQQAARCTQIAKIHLVPTCVDHRRYPIAKHWRTGNGVQLVWIGSSSTRRSLADAEAGIREATRRVAGLTLKVICDTFPEFPGLQVLPVRWSSDTETQEIADADIGMAWLPDHPWSLGKCGLKVLQYMAAGLPVIANPLGVHHDLIVHGETGFLAETPTQWGRAVETLANSPDLRRKMGAAGRARLIERYSVETWAPRFADLVDHLAAGRGLATTAGAKAA